MPRTWPVRLTIALAALGLLAGCARGGPSPLPPTPPPAGTEPGPATGAPAGTATATTAPTPAATATPEPQVFTLGLANAPGTLDPANAADEAALVIVRHLYEGLTAFAPGSTRVVPALAEGWEASPDGLVWTFRLRQGVTFSDGTPFTAEAAQRNFERWLTGSPPGRYAFWRALFGGMAGEAGPDGEPLALLAAAEAPDARTLVLRLNRPDATLPNTLALPSFAMVSPSAIEGGSAEGLDRASAGTGRYVLQAWPAPELVVLRRNPEHWEAAATGGPDELVFKAISDDTQRLLALQSGEIEGLMRLNPRDYAAVQAAGSGARVAFDPALNVLYLGFNQARAPWGNRDCRLAVAYALDKARYVQTYFPGDAQVAAAMQPPAVWGYPAEAADRAYDLALAQQHWQACLAAGTPLPQAVSLYVPPVARPYLPDPAGLAGAIQADLAAATGVSVTITTPDWETAWLGEVYAGQADLFLLGWVGVNGDPDSFLCPLFCGLEGAFNNDGRGNPLPPDPDLAALLLQARSVPDPAAREALYAQAHARIFETVPAVPLAHRQAAWAFTAGVEGHVPSPIESVFFDLRWAE